MPNKPRYKLPTEERLVRSAVHYLERYASSAANLRKVLERKVIKACAAHERDPSDFEAMIDKVVERCAETGLVNDRTYAETKTASLRRRGGSRRKIEAQLLARGVDRNVIHSALESDENSDIDAARIFARRRRLGPYRTSSKNGKDDQRREKDLAAMCRAGFSYAIARRIVEETEDSDG